MRRDTEEGQKMRSKVLSLAVLACLWIAGRVDGNAQNFNLTVAVLVNSSNSTGYNTNAATPGEYQKYAERYFENFQIPYQVFDVSTSSPPADLNSRQLIIGATGSALGTASTSITVPAALAPGGATPHYIAGLQLKTLEDPGDFIYSFHVDQNGAQQTATATVLQGAT